MGGARRGWSDGRAVGCREDGRGEGSVGLERTGGRLDLGQRGTGRERVGGLAEGRCPHLNKEREGRSDRIGESLCSSANKYVEFHCQNSELEMYRGEEEREKMRCSVKPFQRNLPRHECRVASIMH